MIEALTERQRREIDYHRVRADTLRDEVGKPVNLQALDPAGKFRWWNAYWVILRRAKQLYRPGHRALVIGAGFGDDAVQLAAIGYAVSAIDLSPESVKIASERANRDGFAIDFRVSPAEALPYADASFDIVYFPDVIHHIDIPRAMREVRRVMKPTGIALANEPYTHSVVERVVRQSGIVKRVLYPRLVRSVYGTDNPYITEDERKLSERDFARINTVFRVVKRHHFLLLAGRVVSASCARQAKIDRVLLATPGLGYFLAGRVVAELKPR